MAGQFQRHSPQFFLRCTHEDRSSYFKRLHLQSHHELLLVSQCSLFGPSWSSQGIGWLHLGHRSLAWSKAVTTRTFGAEALWFFIFGPANARRRLAFLDFFLPFLELCAGSCFFLSKLVFELIPYPWLKPLVVTLPVFNFIVNHDNNFVIL